jgi:transposase
MARAYGLDLRRWVVEAIDGGMSARAAGARFSVGISTAIKWHRRWRETGSLEPGRQGKPARSKLDAHEAFILDLVDGQKDIALHEIAEKLAREQGLQTCPATVWYFLSKRGLTHKKRRATPQSNSARMSSRGVKPGLTARSTSTRRV